MKANRRLKYGGLLTVAVIGAVAFLILGGGSYEISVDPSKRHAMWGQCLRSFGAEFRDDSSRNGPEESSGPLIIDGRIFYAVLEYPSSLMWALRHEKRFLNSDPNAIFNSALHTKVAYTRAGNCVVKVYVPGSVVRESDSERVGAFFERASVGISKRLPSRRYSAIDYPIARTKLWLDDFLIGMSG